MNTMNMYKRPSPTTVLASKKKEPKKVFLKTQTELDSLEKSKTSMFSPKGMGSAESLGIQREY